MRICVCQCGCLQRPEESVRSPVSYLMLVLGIEPWSFRRAAWKADRREAHSEVWDGAWTVHLLSGQLPSLQGLHVYSNWNGSFSVRLTQLGSSGRSRPPLGKCLHHSCLPLVMDRGRGCVSQTNCFLRRFLLCCGVCHLNRKQSGTDIKIFSKPRDLWRLHHVNMIGH